MDKKRGDGLKGLHLFCLNQALGKLDIAKARGGFVSDALEQVKILDGKRRGVDPIPQGDHAHQFAPGHHRNANAVPTLLGKVPRMTLLEPLHPLFARMVDVHGIRMRAERLNQVADISQWPGQVARPGLGQGGRGREEVVSVVVREPNADREHFKVFRHEPGRGATEAACIQDGGGLLGKSRPDLAIIIERPPEMPTHKTLGSLSNPV